MWLVSSAAVAALYIGLRASAAPAPTLLGVVPGLLADALLFIVAGLWLYRVATRWHDRAIPLTTVFARLALMSIGASLLAFGAVTLLWWLGQRVPTMAGLMQALAEHGAGGFFVDHLFFWMVAATAVPLPWIAAAPHVEQPKDVANTDVIFVRTQARVTAVEPGEIDYVVSADNYLELHCGEQTHLYRMTLTAFVARYPSVGFIRAGRGLVVNAARLSALETSPGGAMAVVLRSGERLPVARRWRSRVRQFMGRSPLS